jgi:hypothetical protein
MIRPFMARSGQNALASQALLGMALIVSTSEDSPRTLCPCAESLSGSGLRLDLLDPTQANVLGRHQNRFIFLVKLQGVAVIAIDDRASTASLTNTSRAPISMHALSRVFNSGRWWYRRSLQYVDAWVILTVIGVRMYLSNNESTHTEGSRIEIRESNDSPYFFIRLQARFCPSADAC